MRYEISIRDIKYKIKNAIPFGSVLIFTITFSLGVSAAVDD